MPTELVESWLLDAQPKRFGVEKIWPLAYSQFGIASLARGECDLACTDRLLNVRELEQFGDQKVAGRRVAFYGFALYVHPENPLDAIFARHLRMVMSREITDWRQLGGDEIPDLAGPIHVYGTAKSTRAGTHLAQMARIWFAEPTWTVLEFDADIIARVADDPFALGFASIGHDERVRYLGLRMQRIGPPAFPSIEEIESERYGLAKLVYVYYISPPTPKVQAVLDYLYSEPGRAAIESTDLWAIPLTRATVRTPPP